MKLESGPGDLERESALYVADFPGEVAYDRVLVVKAGPKALESTSHHQGSPRNVRRAFCTVTAR